MTRTNSTPVPEPCGIVAQGHVCIRERLHPGAHRAETGHWWPYSIDGDYSLKIVFTP